jgi:two-component sensor histidine kinase
LRRSGTRLVLPVRDSGVGLPANKLKQTNRSMGLRLVDALAKQIGAKASFKSEAGTIFTLSVPRSAIDPERAAQSRKGDVG